MIKLIPSTSRPDKSLYTINMIKILVKMNRLTAIIQQRHLKYVGHCLRKDKKEFIKYLYIFIFHGIFWTFVNQQCLQSTDDESLLCMSGSQREFTHLNIFLSVSTSHQILFSQNNRFFSKYTRILKIRC